jgi:hypothetical protein
MAEAGLFIGWSVAVRGREQKSLEVFGEAVGYWASLEEDGKIESSEVVLLRPHGGDLGGFMLLKGSEAQIDAVQREEEFGRIVARGNLVVESFGVVPAVLGDAIGPQMQLFQEQISQLT